jgi:hypothetical protein
MLLLLSKRATQFILLGLFFILDIMLAQHVVLERLSPRKLLPAVRTGVDSLVLLLDMLDCSILGRKVLLADPTPEGIAGLDNDIFKPLLFLLPLPFNMLWVRIRHVNSHIRAVLNDQDAVVEVGVEQGGG